MPQPWTQPPTGADVGYLLRTSTEDSRAGVGWSDFRWPESGYVEARGRSGLFPGLYGLLDGVGDWSMLPRHKAATWQVVAVLRSECRRDPLGAAHSAPRGWVVYSGDAVGALRFILPHMLRSERLPEILASSDAVQLEESEAAANAPPPGDSAPMGDPAATRRLVHTCGQGRHAVATGGDAQATGACGAAVALRGGTATATGVGGNALTVRSLNDAVLSACLGFASAGLGGVAVAVGPGTAARAQAGGAVVLTEYERSDFGAPALRGCAAFLVDGDTIHPGRWYQLRKGEPVEVAGPRPGGYSGPFPPPRPEKLVPIETGGTPDGAGLFRDIDSGQVWRLYQPACEDRARNDSLTRALYEAAGVRVAGVHLVEHGGRLVAAMRVPEGLTLAYPGTLATTPGVLEGFVADAWLGNREVLGSGCCGLLVSDGEAVRMSTSGALRFRPDGARKSAGEWGDEVRELDRMRDPVADAQAAAVFGDIGQEQLHEGAQRVLGVTPRRIRELCAQHMPGDPAAASSLAARLIARQSDIARRFPQAAMRGRDRYA